MDTLIDLAKSLNLSPVNTLLLLILCVILNGIFRTVLQGIFARLAALEGVVTRNSKSIAFIKGRMRLKELDDR